MPDYTKHNDLYYLPDQIDHAQALIDQAIAQTGTHQPGQRVKVTFSGCFFCNEGEEPPEHYNRHRLFSVTFANTEQFMSNPSLTAIFERYGIVEFGVYVLWVNKISVEYV